MQKKPKPFIDLLESKHLLAPEIVEELRKQVAESKTRLTPELLAKLLVDNGHLTKFQATKLIAELNQQADAAEPDEEGLGFASEEEEELGFAPEAEAGDGTEESSPIQLEDEQIASVFAEQTGTQLAEVVDVEPVEVVEIVGEVDAGAVAEAVEVVEALPAGAARYRKMTTSLRNHGDGRRSRSAQRSRRAARGIHSASWVLESFSPCSWWLDISS